MVCLGWLPRLVAFSLTQRLLSQPRLFFVLKDVMQQVIARPVWFWRMGHPDFGIEWGMRIERPLVKDDSHIYVSVTVNGHIHRNGDGLLMLWRAPTLEPLLAYGDLWRKELRANGWRDVEDE